LVKGFEFLKRGKGGETKNEEDIRRFMEVV
jgi:hypothetical protein